jgi:hypothetical protein
MLPPHQPKRGKRRKSASKPKRSATFARREPAVRQVPGMRVLGREAPEAKIVAARLERRVRC